jgi:hypothetical protein
LRIIPTLAVGGAEARRKGFSNDREPQLVLRVLIASSSFEEKN